MQKNPTQKLIKDLYELMHQHGIRKDDEFVSKLIVMLVLSQNSELPDDITLDESLAEYKGEWLKLIKALQVSEDAQVRRLFSYDESLEQLPLPLLHSAMKILSKYQEVALYKTAEQLINIIINQSSSSSVALPDLSVSILVNALLGDKEGKTIYATAPASLPFCAIASEESQAVYYETVNYSGMLADALSIISNNRFEVYYSNPLEKPYYSVSKNELRCFNYGVSFSPMGAAVPKHISDNIDGYDRFVVQTKKIESANILHLIKQCQDVVIASVTEGILYSTMERDLRQYLVDKGMLKAVISLPSGIWTGTFVKTSLLVIEPHGNNESVRFVDVTGDEFVEKTTRRLISLNDIDKIVEYVNSDEELKSAVSVNKEVLRSKEYGLDTSAYILDVKEKAAASILENSKTVILDNIVRFERGLPFKPEEGDHIVLEVGANELNEIGDITQPTKEVKVSEVELNKNQSGILQPNDIILILKGSAGKVGIVPEDAPTKGDRCWMANRSGIVLRVNSNLIDAKALYAYLKSDLGQVQLSSLVKGASIPNISLKELKTLPVVLLTLDEQQKAVSIVDKSRETQKAIQQLLLEHEQRRSELWGLKS